ncbi:MAG: hypothetical protein Q7Q73_00120 [Verrucomicrobiota bacterium JB024]|nr:hypothetical protein [Verrucomicrobiota bacterium JB024]
MYASPPVSGAGAEAVAESTKVPPYWANEGKALVLAKGTAPVPVGLYAMVRMRHCLPGETGEPPEIDAIAVQPFVQALALGVTWIDLQPEPGEVSFVAVERALEAVAAASRQAGRDRPMPVLLKIYPSFLPGWMASDETDDEGAQPRIVTNKIGMRVLHLPPEIDATGHEHPAREFPLSTDPVYRENLDRLRRVLAEGLDRVDPHAVLVSAIHVIGPAMDSNQMRTPANDLFPNRGPDPWGAGWSKQAHLEAWREVCARMADYPAFARRAWVFNFTNLPPRGDEGLSLTVAEQESVFETVRAVHPAGPAAVIGKTESLCVDFNRRTNRPELEPHSGSAWRTQMATRADHIPYGFLARLPLAHAWENWAGFSPGRDARAPSLYPFDELVENSLYLDPDHPQTSRPQGTLWVEIWPQEAARPERVPRFDDSPQSLRESLIAWDEAIRVELRVLVPPAQK